MNKNILITILVSVVIGAAAFYAGMKYQQSLRGQFQNRNGGTQNNRPTGGTILSIDEKSLTLKLANGSSKIVLFSDKTTINKTETGSMTDLAKDSLVTVMGTTNTDGSITAANIQISSKKKSAEAKEYIIDGSNFKFVPDTLTLKKNEKSRILFKNSGGFHDFRIDELNIATEIINTGAEDFVEFVPNKAGTFEFYCSVSNHKAMGMKGTLVVE